MTSPYVNDLAWLMEGHFIENDLDLSIYWQAGWKSKLLALANYPAPLEDAVKACKSHFLGSYFEVLFSYAIRHFSTLTVLLEHQQVVEQGKTLGEVDMLVETPDGTLLQFEIAIKFYLERPSLYPEHWIGPNKNDSLYKKVSRARAHQLTIMETASAKEQWQDILKGRPVTPCLLIYGRLFLSLNDDSNRLDCIRKTGFGGWIYAAQATSLLAEFAQARTVKKPHWLSLSDFYDDYVPFTAEAITAWSEAFHYDARPIYLCLSKGAQEIDAGVKYSLFVVPNTW